MATGRYWFQEAIEIDGISVQTSSAIICKSNLSVSEEGIVVVKRGSGIQSMR